VQIVRKLSALRAATAELREKGGDLALVPTMGALHDGHMALVDEAKRRAKHVAVSIFVNPKQFGPNEDLDAYPRREARDTKLLKAAEIDLLWLPSVEEMYPDGFGTTVSVARLGEALCGSVRPGHFDGVATVVAKLLNQVRPDVAIFGEKDWQQLAIIRRLVADLNIGVRIAGMLTQRAEDGLALSSRNAYLSPADRITARTLPRALGEAAAAIMRGGDVATALGVAQAQLEAAGFAPIDYVSLVDAMTLEPLTQLSGEARLLAAARLHGTRLIDNLAVNEPAQ
jgi:pantoate--beta-alanine ligase